MKKNYEHINLKDLKNLKSEKNKLLDLILMSLEQIEIDLKAQLLFKNKYNINLIFKNKTNTYYIYNSIKNFNYKIRSNKNKHKTTLSFVNHILELID